MFNRRGFLKHLTGLATLAPIAALPIPKPESEHEITEEQALAALGAEPIGPPPPPYPDPQRTATIDHWIQVIDEVLIPLETFWTFLHEARAQAPDVVSPADFARLEDAARDQMNSLCSLMETITFDELARAITGKPCWYTYVINYIELGDQTPAVWQREIDGFRERYPDVADELQTILDTRFGVRGGAA